MTQALTATGHFARSFGMFERQALAEDIERKALSLGRGVVLPFTRDTRSKGVKPFACLSGTELGFSEKASRQAIFGAISERGGILLEKDDEFIFASDSLRHCFSGCSVLYTEPFLHGDLLVLPALHCGQRILIDPISASDEPLWNPNTRWIFGL